MKTESTYSIATILSVTAVFNLSALARPGQQALPQFRKATEVKVAVATHKEWKARIAEKSATKPRSMGSLAVADAGIFVCFPVVSLFRGDTLPSSSR